MTLLLALLITCPATKIVNKTDTWEAADKAALEHASSRCKEIYQDAPCLKVFIKKEKLLYNAICGVDKPINL